MIITNKITGRNCTKYAIGLLDDLITQKEFELLVMIPPSETKVKWNLSDYFMGDDDDEVLELLKKETKKRFK